MFGRMGKGLLATLAVVAGMSGSIRAEDQPEGLTDEEAKEAIQFIYGNAVFVLLHETGHMLISELNLPVLGREEDAVDALSSVLLLEAHNETLDTAITDSADGWFLSDQEREATGGEEAYWDTHALNKQRAYQMVCMMVGQDAEGFKEFADSVDFPDSRREECKYEYEKTRDSWMGLLQPHALPEGQKNNFTVTYEEPPKELEAYAQMLKEATLLETIADSFASLYKLPDGIQIIATSCGQPNAFWLPGDRKLVFCYELAAYHDQLISKWLVDNRDSGNAGDTEGNEDQAEVKRAINQSDDQQQ